MVDDSAPGMVDLGHDNAGLSDVVRTMGEIHAPAPANVKPEPRPNRDPPRISGGVAAGRLLVPIQPEYPPIARGAHVQGTVVVEAIISKEGRVERARIVSGPPMLSTAAQRHSAGALRAPTG
jgi:periplasmic protein TonB